jgi:hypothetical protein
VKLKSPLHRTAAVLAGAIIGLVGVTAAAGPASAHNASVTGKATCADGKNVVTWKFNNDYPTGATVQDLQLPAGATPQPAIAGGDTLHNGLVLNPGDTEFTQVVDSAQTVDLSFTAYWAQPDQYTDPSTNPDNHAQVTLDKDCGKTVPPPCVSAKDAGLSHTFAVDKVGGTTIITLKPGTTICDDEKIWITSASYYAPKPQFDVPQYLFDSDHGYVSNDNTSLKLWVRTPPCYTQVDTFFDTQDQHNLLQSITANGPRYGNLKLGSPGAPGNRSVGPVAAYNGGDKSCATPASTSVPNCNGSQTINLSNNGKYDETFSVKYGDQVKTVTVGAGKGESVTVPASSTTATVSAEGMADQTYTWTAPKDCALPTAAIVNTCKDVTITVTNPKDVVTAKATVTYGKQTKELTVAAGSSAKATFAAGSEKYATIKFAGVDQELKAALKKLTCTTPVGNNSGGGTLAITGPAGGSIAAGAAVLLIAGGVFFFIARRRKVRFTA